MPWPPRWRVAAAFSSGPAWHPWVASSNRGSAALHPDLDDLIQNELSSLGHVVGDEPFATIERLRSRIVRCDQNKRRECAEGRIQQRLSRARSVRFGENIDRVELE